MNGDEKSLAIRPARFVDPDTQRLVAEVQLEYVERYGGPDETPLEEGAFDPPGGAFFLGYLGRVPVAMGGWRRRDDVHPWGCRQAAEVKRMYVASTGRRRGFARAILARLESSARAAGADVMVLETGTAQPEAIALYTAMGYQQIEKFGYYAWSPKTRCFGKRL
jgi:GNAT superfamily N-acetyltransferase